MDEIERIEVNETEIAPFLPEIFRKLDWLSKEDLVKRIVSREFGHFLSYYADAPAIEQPSERRSTRSEKETGTEGRRKRSDNSHKAEEGYTRLFINLGKRDNFYAREIINLVNRHVRGTKIEIGRIDLTTNCSFFEVPTEDAPLVLSKMKRVKVGDRKVIVDNADRDASTASQNTTKHERNDSSYKKEPHGRTYAEVADARQMKQGWKAEKKARKAQKKKDEEFGVPRKARKDDWRKFFE